MCDKCYENAGSPKIDNERVRLAASLIEEVYRYSPVGGNLHIAIDDWNLDDDSLSWCEMHSLSADVHDNGPEALEAEWKCLAALKALSEPERYSALAMKGGRWD